MRPLKIKKCARIALLAFTPDGGRLAVFGGAEVLTIDFVAWLDNVSGKLVVRHEQCADQWALAPDHSRVALGRNQYGPNAKPEHYCWLQVRHGDATITIEPRPWHVVSGWPSGRIYLTVGGMAFGRTNADVVLFRNEIFQPLGGSDLANHGLLEDWQLTPPHKRNTVELNRHFHELAQTLDGEFLALAGTTTGGELLQVYHWRSHNWCFDYRPKATKIHAIAIDPTGRYLACASGRVVELFDFPDAARSMHEPSVVRWSMSESRSQMNSLAFTSGGDRLLCASHDGVVRMCDSMSGEILARWDFQIGPTTALAIAPDGLTAAVGGKKGAIVVFDLEV